MAAIKSDKDIRKYSKDELIQLVAKTSSVNVSIVKIVMKALENVIFSTLKNVSFDEDVSIKIFKGLYIDGTYIPDKQIRNNLTGKLIDVTNKIKIKARITREYLEKINQ